MSRPFDEARYKGLLEGLEVAEIPLSALERTKRVDAEYFQPKHLRIAHILAACPGDPITKVAAISDGNHFSISEEFSDEGVPYYRGQDVVGHFFIEQASPVFITEKAYHVRHMVRSHLKRGDVLLSIVGTIGEISLVASDAPATCSCKLAILRPHDIAPEYFAVFLRTLHGRSQIERLTRGAVQMGLLLEDMDQIKVVRLSPDFEQRIVQMILEARRELENAQGHTQRAEQTLLCALGLQYWQPPEPLTYRVTKSEVFSTGRMDSQFFQPKFAALKDKMVKRFPVCQIGTLARTMKGQTVPYSLEGSIPIIRSGDLGDLDNREKFLKASKSEPIFYLQKGDVLVSSIGFGSIGKVQMFDYDDAHGTVSEVSVIRQDSVNPYFLTYFLRSRLGQLQIERYITGATGQLHLYPSGIDEIWIPLIDMSDQQLFEKLHETARNAKQQATKLLDVAKHAVEIAIEQSEVEALAYLKAHGA